MIYSLSCISGGNPVAEMASWLDLVLWMGVVSISVSIILHKGLLLFLSLFYSFSNTLKLQKQVFFHVKSLALPLLFVRKRTAIICFCLVDKHLDQTSKNRLVHHFPITHKKKMSDWLYWNLGDPVESWFELGRGSWLFLSLFYSSILVFSDKKCLNAVCEEGDKLPSSVSVL